MTDITAGSFGPITLTAVNTASQSENRIHDDEVARRYGFKGGLVPGVGVYGYLCRPLTASLGPEWMRGAAASVRFSRPVYEGERYTVVTLDGPEGCIFTEVHAEDGTVCARCSFTLDAQEVVDPEPRYVRRPGEPRGRQPIALHLLAAGYPLAPYREDVSPEDVFQYSVKTGDDDVVYRRDDPLVHPFILLQQANSVFATNFALGPWIHTASEITHVRPVFAPIELETFGEVVEAYERNGHHYVVLDTLTLSDGIPVQRVIHTAIFQVAERG